MPIWHWPHTIFSVASRCIVAELVLQLGVVVLLFPFDGVSQLLRSLFPEFEFLRTAAAVSYQQLPAIVLPYLLAVFQPIPFTAQISERFDFSRENVLA